MRVTMSISASELKKFNNSLEAVITKVGKGSRRATVEACRIISEHSLNEVPRDTETLANSQFWEVDGYYKTGFVGTVGYGGNGDPVNPKSGQPASAYMVKVHEDLTASHPNGGKAKFLEDPIREYAKENFPRTVIKHLNEALE